MPQNFLKKIISAGNIQLGGIRDQQKIDFVQSLKLLMDSGITIQEGLETIFNQTEPGTYRNFLFQAREKIEKGGSLYLVCRESGHFDLIFLNFIKVGEETGSMSQALSFLAEWLDNHLTLKREISAVTLYPKILIIFALTLGLGLSFWILPGVVAMIEGLGVEPFLTTKILLFISNLVQGYWPYIISVIGFLIVFYFTASKIPFFKRIKDWLAIRLPIIGSFTRDYQLTIISQVAFTLYRSGIPASQIFRIITESSPNFYYQKSMLKTTESVEKGTSPSRAMMSFPRLYPASFISVIGVGEKAGTLEQSFFYLSRFFQARVLHKTKTLPTIIEPIVFIIIGLFVFFIASALILPIYELTTGIR